MSKIIDIKAREILASGGLPTVEARIYLKSGAVGMASVPYGVSAGSREAVVLVDEDKRYGGKGALKAVNNINTLIRDVLMGMGAENQRKVDEKMIGLDGTRDKSFLGGNAILAVSLAVARAAAIEKKMELYKYIRECFEIDFKDWQLPKPMAVLIEGGKHADNSTDLQEYLLTVTKEGINASEGVRMMAEIYQNLAKVLKERGFVTNVGNEGAFAPAGIEDNEKPMDMILEAVMRANYEIEVDCGISIDAAASEFFEKESRRYELKLEGKSLTSRQMVDYVMDIVDNYPIVTVEDMLDEDDWQAWIMLTDRLTKMKITNIADDLTVTNTMAWQRAINERAASGILIKLNQAGTLTETVDCTLLASKSGLPAVPSHRGGGETNDTFMVDLAVALNCPWIKVGPTRGERVCKYNRLLEIESELEE
jgi:enolase